MANVPDTGVAAL
jgi:hypothetical protein